MLCFGGGILAGLVGGLLAAINWIVGAEQHPIARAVSTALLVATIPLLIFAGYCLDWMERDLNEEPMAAAEKRTHLCVPVSIALATVLALGIVVLQTRN